jgi:hypothetical protein
LAFVDIEEYDGKYDAFWPNQNGGDIRIILSVTDH